MERCNGFLVVRLPHENYDVRGRGAFESSVPHIENNFYGGVDRMAWFDVDEDHYTGALPSHLTVMRTNIQNTNEDFSGLLVCRDLDVARDLLRYSNRRAVKNELITIHAKGLTELKGE